MYIKGRAHPYRKLPSLAASSLVFLAVYIAFLVSTLWLEKGSTTIYSGNLNFFRGLSSGIYRRRGVRKKKQLNSPRSIEPIVSPFHLAVRNSIKRVSLLIAHTLSLPCVCLAKGFRKTWVSLYTRPSYLRFLVNSLSSLALSDVYSFVYYYSPGVLPCHTANDGDRIDIYI